MSTKEHGTRTADKNSKEVPAMKTKHWKMNDRREVDLARHPGPF